MKRTSISCQVVALTLLTLVTNGAEKISVVSIDPEELVEYADQPENVRQLIDTSLSLTSRKLGYQFGSNSPGNRGMDCSGTVQCLLQKLGMTEVPRSSLHMYQWAEAAGTLVKTPDATSTGDEIFKDLRPGDLLFWKGTYDTGEPGPAISHVMIYLGTLKEDGEGVVFGASSGRRYRGKTIHGVSVFDWTLPKPESESSFVGYARIPGFPPPEETLEPPKEKKNPLKSALEVLFKKSETSPP